jgi:hypothetical protein
MLTNERLEHFRRKRIYDTFRKLEDAVDSLYEQYKLLFNHTNAIIEMNSDMPAEVG